MRRVNEIYHDRRFNERPETKIWNVCYRADVEMELEEKNSFQSTDIDVYVMSSLYEKMSMDSLDTSLNRFSEGYVVRSQMKVDWNMAKKMQVLPISQKNTIRSLKKYQGDSQ